ncbi:SH3 and multiple ankyrin repeat domains protein 1 isoform X4 [Rhipicephalus sanguineus]|uniref:SH3 and multiple ankyrin repeat domains protein 1 isoform X4 n=1 Tax=Rhipicephalus sanguineus TaxID=34632 RepID=UPI0020C468C0|nr:SH3 and multiple ankyrin repeat domains protein 1 isoform X4 [Rhipicephalus sanguineus]
MDGDVSDESENLGNFRRWRPCKKRRRNCGLSRPVGSSSGAGTVMKAVAMETVDDTVTTEDQLVPLQVFVPDLVIQKCFHVQKDELIWDIKQHIISSLPKEVKEGFNYGLYCPPVNGKAGKFLDEERPIADYPLSDAVAYLELRYKRRVYKMINVEEKQIKQLHTRANLRRMLDHVTNSNVDKISKLCTRGLDPNFHCPDTGAETPLTLAAGLKSPSKVIIALVNGGALLDYRTKDGRTALHRAVEKNNLEALKTLLDLGASPNYKDARGLTPLYYTVLWNADPQLAETLLHDHATLGVADPQGWQEVHQACKHGLVQHLEQLLFYGADMNARNASGNTPLHVCAVNDRESCARVLLFRGADPAALNYANQNPYQVAVIAGNLALADVIKNHKPEDVDKSATSESSGVCTSNSAHSCDSSTDSSDTPEVITVGTTCVCVTEYQSPLQGHLSLNCGDIVQVTEVSDTGMLEGRTRDGRQGMFPSAAVQEVKMRGSTSSQGRVRGRREMQSTSGAATLPRRWRMYGEPRTVVLQKSKKGFGFVLRGAKATSPLMERLPTENWPSLQYLDDVDQGGVADLAGLKRGDFLLEINGQDVSQATHECVVNIILQQGDLIAMTVLTVAGTVPGLAFSQGGSSSSAPSSAPGSEAGSVPAASSSVTPPMLQANGAVAGAYRQCATLPRKLSAKKAPAPPKRDPKTTLSVGRARAKSMVAGLTDIEVLDRTLNEYDSEGRSTKSSSIESIPKQNGTTSAPAASSNASASATATAAATAGPEGTKTASIRSRPVRMTAAELEEFLTRQSAERKPRVFGSVAAMKRAARGAGPTILKDFNSEPELNAAETDLARRRSRSQENLAIYGESWKKMEEIWKKPATRIYAETTATATAKQPLPAPPSGNTSASTPPAAVSAPVSAEQASQSSRKPPPSHPPPPPPVGQMLKVDVSNAMGDYANVDGIPDSKVMSSFRPGDSAKLYASPESLTHVAYKTSAEARGAGRPGRTPAPPGSGTRSQSLPPRIQNREPSETRENVVYSTFRVVQPTPETGTARAAAKGKKVRGPASVQEEPPPPPEKPPYIPEPDYDSTDEEDEQVSRKLKSGDMGTFKASSGGSRRDEAPPPPERAPTTTTTMVTAVRHDSDPKVIATKSHTLEPRSSRAQETIVHIKRDPLESEKLVLEVSAGSVRDNISAFEKRSAGSSTAPRPTKHAGSRDHHHHLHDEPENSSSGVSSDVEVERQELRSYDQAALSKRLSAYYLQRRQSAENLVPVTTTAATAAPVVSNLDSHLNQRNMLGRHQQMVPPVSSSAASMAATASSIVASNQAMRRPQAADNKAVLGGIPKKTLKIRLDQKVHATRRTEGAPRATDAAADGSSLKRSIDESLDFIRLQIDSLGLSSVNEADMLTELVPPPPEFSHGVRPQQAEPIAPPPPEFSDEYHRRFDHHHQPVPPHHHQPQQLPQHQPQSQQLARHQAALYHQLNQPQQQQHLPAAYCRYNGSPQHHHSATLRPTSSAHHQPRPTVHDVYRPGYGTLGRRTDPQVLVVPIERQAGDLARLKSVQREFRQKPLVEWSARDVSDWLESLFLQEYRPRFVEAGITGVKLANMDSNDFMGLGVKQVGHRVNMERSLRRYMK